MTTKIDPPCSGRHEDTYLPQRKASVDVPNANDSQNQKTVDQSRERAMEVMPNSWRGNWLASMVSR